MVRGKLVMGFSGLMALLAAPALAGNIAPDLREILDSTPPNQVVSVFVFLQEQTDLAALNARFEIARAPREERHELVVLALQALAAETQGPLLAYLQQALAAGRVQSFREFWIDNSFRVDAFPAEIEALAAREDVGTVYLNYPIELINPVNDTGTAKPADGGGTILAPENGLIAIKAPQVWAMGIDGTGVLTSTLDTGVDGNHPALASRWRGVADPRYAGNPKWAWFDPVTNTVFPQAFGSHGTHTMGTVCGGAPGLQVGVAPGAQWIHAAVIDRESILRTVADAKLSFQWMLDPDGNPNTAWDVPQVNSNSWGVTTGHGYPNCDPAFWTFLDACQTAGTVVFFSAGNESTSGLRRPADRATDAYRSSAVAAVDAQTQIQPPWNLASFSSRGPTNCTPNGQPAIKPDIAAPGVNVNSSVPGGYSQFSGTSMASPHVNGVAALMLQANPTLSVTEVMQIIYDTAIDQGTPGEDNSYGWGMINAEAAVIEALARAGIRFEFPNGLPTQLDYHGGTSFPVNAIGQNLQVQPGSGKLHYDAGSGFVEIAMNEGNLGEYTAVFPALPCGVDVRFYVSCEDTQGGLHTSPFNAPQTTYAADTHPGFIPIWNDDFETDRGWTVVNQNLQTGAWVRAVPIAPARVQEPLGDFDGSGRCFVTGNTANEDVDGGPTILTSPLIDLSGSSRRFELFFGLWFTASNTDFLVIEASNNNGQSWTLVQSTPGPGANSWGTRSYPLNAIIQPTSQMRFRFSIADNPNDSVDEVAVDAFTIRYIDCPSNELGDLNCDGAIDAFDIEPFTLALFDPPAYKAQYPDCDRGLADINGDGNIDAFDIGPFIDLLFGP